MAKFKCQIIKKKKLHSGEFGIKKEKDYTNLKFIYEDSEAIFFADNPCVSAMTSAKKEHCSLFNCMPSENFLSSPLGQNIIEFLLGRKREISAKELPPI